MENLDLSQFDFKSLFPNNHPVEVEVGCGRAKFLVSRAQQNPEINFIAFDRLWKYAKVGKRRADYRELKNILFFKTEAREFLSQAIPDQSVQAFHVYFPDPWPKRKYHKRRLVGSEFLKLLARKTLPEGWLRIATDNAQYYQQIKKAMDENVEHWRLVRENRNDGLFEGLEPTNYEMKYLAEGRTLYYLESQRTDQLITSDQSSKADYLQPCREAAPH